ncbi:4714_t:CDS:2 [Paraglomus brasilianum]|uniref:4714_t:CDS:1 n=1 Tax=Paraglomus brasilianum TaxID=144538 RepID=A0A9N9GSJ5_9GLOM|nr:4714_t:CDS:2 [Paraglomus brasilianum]
METGNLSSDLNDTIAKFHNELRIMYKYYDEILDAIQQLPSEAVQDSLVNTIDQVAYLCLMYDQEYTLKETISNCIQYRKITEQENTVFVAVWNIQPFVEEDKLKFS